MYNNSFKGKVQLRQTDTVFKTYTREEIRPKGVMTVRVQHSGTSADLELFAATKGGTPLFGRYVWWPSLDRSIERVAVECSNAR